MNTNPQPRRWLTPLRIFQIVLGLMILGGSAYLLRTFAGLNQHTVLPGKVYRCAQPSPAELERLIQEKQIRTVVNLRGVAQMIHVPRSAWYRDEAIVTANTNISQEDVTLSARLLPPPAELRRLIEILDHAEKPILIHCKQGADRTGLASAIVWLLYTDATLALARQQLWPIYGHFPVGGTVAMDDFFDRYEAWLAEQNSDHKPELFRQWALHIYRPGVAESQLEWLTPPEASVPLGRPTLWKVRATNTSGDIWHFEPGHFAAIHLMYKVSRNGNEWIYENRAGLFRRTVAPGESIELDLALPGFDQPGKYTLVAEFLDARGCGVPIRVNSFVKCGDEGLSWEFIVE